MWKGYGMSFDPGNTAVLALGVMIGLALGGVVLRLSCDLINQEAPSLGRAIGIVFAALLCQAALGGVMGFFGWINVRVVFFFSVWLVSGAVYSFLLPAKFLHAMTIWLCQVVMLCISFFILGLLFNLVSRAFAT